MPGRCESFLPLRRQGFVHALATGSAINSSQERRESGTMCPRPLAHEPFGVGFGPTTAADPTGPRPGFPGGRVACIRRISF